MRQEYCGWTLPIINEVQALVRCSHGLLARLRDIMAAGIEADIKRRA
jgi:hypothetical protein